MDKGQAFISDFAVSVAVFSAIVTAFFIPWNSIIEADNRFSVEKDMRTEAERTAAFLVTTEGYPSDWEREGVNVTIPGFAQAENILSAEKIEEFTNISYQNQRSILRTQQFFIEITRNGETLTINGEQAEYGKNPQNSSYTPETSIVVTRQVIIDQTESPKPAEFKYVSWRD